MQVMELRKRMLGEKHPDSLNSMVNLAYTLQSQGRCKEATDLMMRVERLRCEQTRSGNPRSLNGKECWNTCPKTLNSVGTNRKSISRNTPSPMSLFFPTFLQCRPILMGDYFVVAVYSHRISVK